VIPCPLLATNRSQPDPEWSKISSALKRPGFRSPNFLAQLVFETSRVCTIRVRRSSSGRLWNDLGSHACVHHRNRRPGTPSKKTFASPAPPLSQKAKGTRCHEVQFYSDHAPFLAGFTRFVEAALEAGSAVIVVATESHRNSLLQRLQVHGVDILAAIERGTYIPLDVADMLSTFMVNDLPDPVRFLKIAGDLVAAAAKAAKGERPRVAACGECAPILWAQGRADAAIQLEHLWDEIAKTCDVDILCGYVLNSCQREQESHIYERICAEHSAVCFL